jgi:hypothetical protein
MKILKSSFHFQPSDDLFPIDKFRQITEFIKITANLKRRFVMVTTPDILTALSMVMRLEPIGNLLWQGRIEGNQFQIIPDIFHPMNKPGYILIRYVDADTVTLIEFEEHMMGVVGFDSIVGKTEETETEQESDENFQRYLTDLPQVEEQANDPRYFQVAERVGDKYVFDPDICIPSTETCGECIHGVCCMKAKMAKAGAVRKDAQMDARELEPSRVEWDCVAELTEKKLKDHEVPFEHNDYGSSYTVRFDLGKHKYKIKFELRQDLSNLVTISKFDIDPDNKVGSVIYRDDVFNPDSMNEYLAKLDSILEEEVVEELAKDQPKEEAKEQPKEVEESDDIPVWKAPIEKIEKLLYNYRIEYKREDSDSCHYIRYENGYKEYCVYFENRDDLLPGSYRAVFSEKEIGAGKCIWDGLIDSYNMLHELERAIVERIKPMENEEC